MAAALTNSGQPWLSAQAMHKVKPVNTATLMGEGMGAPTPSGGVNDSWWLLGEKGLVFFKDVVLAGWPSFRSWPHTHAYTGSNNWTQWVIEKKKKEEEVKLAEVWEDPGSRIWEMGEYDKNIL